MTDLNSERRGLLANIGLSMVLGGLMALLMRGGAALAADQPVPPKAFALYFAEGEDHWNRLHRALFARVDSDGKELGLDGVDPLLWPETRHLLTGPSHESALRALDEFLKQEAVDPVRDPLKRVVLQHDLWALFDWTAFPYGNLSGVGEHQVARRALRGRLAQAIGRLALRPAAVEALPDNYAQAVKSEAFRPAFDPSNPEAPFLPPDLFDPAGPWVCVGSSPAGAEPVALAHARFFSGRSVFLSFLRLPGGRAATLAYLGKLNDSPTPWVLRPRKSGEGGRPEVLRISRDLPQFQVGTQVALVRRMVLVTDEGEPIASPVTESVQLRVYRRVRAQSDDTEVEVRRSQSMFELTLRKADLFAGRAGGFHSVREDEPALLAFQFLTGYEDPFETPAAERHFPLMPVMLTCSACHTGSGIYSVASFTRRFSALREVQADLTLWPSSVADERSKLLKWKRERYDWGLLKGLTER